MPHSDGWYQGYYYADGLPAGRQIVVDARHLAYKISGVTYVDFTIVCQRDETIFMLADSKVYGLQENISEDTRLAVISSEPMKIKPDLTFAGMGCMSNRLTECTLCPPGREVKYTATRRCAWCLALICRDCGVKGKEQCQRCRFRRLMRGLD